MHICKKSNTKSAFCFLLSFFLHWYHISIGVDKNEVENFKTLYIVSCETCLGVATMKRIVRLGPFLFFFTGFVNLRKC